MNKKDNIISVYKQRLNLQDAIFHRIDHEDAMVAIVYKIIQSNGTQLILKICERPNDYFREIYFLTYFADKLPVPRIIKTIEPENGIMGSILMEYLPGNLLKITDFTQTLAYETGSLLARIHSNHMSGYGDLIKQNDLSSDPGTHFTMKFEEGLAECNNHLSKSLIEKVQQYYNAHLNLLESADGPCIVHRDFRPGNIIIYNNKIEGIIDWSSGRAGFTQEDFCSMEHTEWSIDSATKKSFLEGYSSIRPVPNYDTIMPLLRLSKAIATIGFTVKRGTYKNINAHLYGLNRHFLEEFFQ